MGTMTTQKIKAKLAELEAMERAATPGPWRDDSEGTSLNVFADFRDDVAIIADADQDPQLTFDETCANAAFIAAAKSEFPSLLATISDLVEALENVKNSRKLTYSDADKVDAIAQAALDRAGERFTL